MSLSSNLLVINTIDTTEGAAVMNLGMAALRYVEERSRRGEIKGESPRTIRTTLGTLVAVAGWDLRPDRLNRSHIERWMQRKPLSAGTLRSQLSIAKTFCGWLVRNGYSRTNATDEIISPRQPRRNPRGVTRTAVADTFAGCPDVRAELIVSLEVQQGLRACEVCNLQVGDIEWDQTPPLMVVHGKGGHQRILPITDETASAMKRYLAEHPASAGPLVRSYLHPNRGLTPHYVSRLVSQWMHEAGVNASGHALRHTMATDSLRRGAHIVDIQKALGHTSLATTQVYLPWLVGDLAKAIGGRTYRRPVQESLF